MADHIPRACTWYTPEEEHELALKSSELRRDQLKWCKERALAELPNVASAITSMVSDARKEWTDAKGDVHPFLFDWSQPVYQLMQADGLLFASRSVADMRHWIEGFN